MFVRRRRVAWLARLVAPLAVLLIVAPLAGAQGAPPQAPVSSSLKGAPSFALYRSTGFPLIDGYVAIDPGTLVDLPSGEALRIGSEAGPAIVSGDGSTAASYDGGEIAIWDLRTGRVRARFSGSGTSDPFANAAPFALSHDGRRLVADVWATNAGTTPPHTWTVFDTATGRVVLTIPEAPTGAQASLFDEVAWRMYRFYGPGAPATTARIVATDLVTGDALGEITVPDLQVGLWPSGQDTGGQTSPSIYVPGLALSPDGQQLVIVHPARDAVTLVNTRPLRLEQTIAFGKQVSRWQRLVALLPLWPQGAEAKGSGGISRRAVFAADGRHLYVFGDRYELDGEQLVVHSLGVAVLDLASGAATGPILTNQRIDRILPAPDGKGVYIASFADNGYFPPTTLHLQRLEATTLRPLAERTVEPYGPLLLIPPVPNSTDVV